MPLAQNAPREWGCALFGTMRLTRPSRTVIFEPQVLLHSQQVLAKVRSLIRASCGSPALPASGAMWRSASADGVGGSLRSSDLSSAADDPFGANRSKSYYMFLVDQPSDITVDFNIVSDENLTQRLEARVYPYGNYQSSHIIYAGTSADSGFNNIGGVIGIVKNSYATLNSLQVKGVINASSINVGGIIGVVTSTSEEATTISNSSSLMTINGKDFVGGLVGKSSLLSINTSYSTSSITGETFLGSLVGSLNDNYISSIQNCYATGTVNSSLENEYVGGLLGYLGSGSSLIASYYIGKTSRFNDDEGSDFIVGKAHNDSLIINTKAPFIIADSTPSEEESFLGTYYPSNSSWLINDLNSDIVESSYHYSNSIWSDGSNLNCASIFNLPNRPILINNNEINCEQ